MQKKRVLFRIIGILFLLFQSVPTTLVKADAVYYGDYVDVSNVADINAAFFSSSKVSYYWEGEHSVCQFEIFEPTIIKAYFSWSQSDEVPGGIAWFSKDLNGVDIIGETKTINSKNKYNLIFLEPGTYYINYSFGKSGSYRQLYNIGLSIVGQKVNINTPVAVSSWDNPNVIKTGLYYDGFLSSAQTTAYYLFSISTKSYVSIDYLFKKIDNLNIENGKCTLYYRNGRVIASKKFDTRNTSNNKISILLESGDYYINLSGVTAPTSLNVTAEQRTNTLTPNTKKYTKKNVTIWLDSSFEYEEALLVSSKVTDTNINSNLIWRPNRNDNCVAIEGDSFTVEKNGWYTIRTEDANNNFVMTRIKITNIDKVPPGTNIVNKKTYTSKKITIKFDDALSGVKSAKLNGKLIGNGKVVRAKGTYKLVFKDYAGNVRRVFFYKK